MRYVKSRVSYVSYVSYVNRLCAAATKSSIVARRRKAQEG